MNVFFKKINNFFILIWQSTFSLKILIIPQLSFKKDRFVMRQSPLEFCLTKFHWKKNIKLKNIVFIMQLLS